MKRSLMLLLTAAAGVFLMGFDLESAVRLQRDLGGTADVRTSADLEVMVQFFSQRPVFKEKEQEMRQGLVARVADAAAKREEDRAADRATLAQTLPAGVKLLSNSLAYEGTKVFTGFAFQFDDARQLARVLLPEGRNLTGPPPSPSGHDPASGANPPTGSAPASGDGSPPAAASQPTVDVQPYVEFFRRPFPDLQVVDEGATIRVTLTVANPVAFARQTVGSQAPAFVTQQIETIYRGSRFHLKLDSPFEVVETNATQRSGRTLTWDIDLTDPNAKVKQALTARLRK